MFEIRYSTRGFNITVFVWIERALLLESVIGRALNGTIMSLSNETLS